jgi:hypothetical protein
MMITKLETFKNVSSVLETLILGNVYMNRKNMSYCNSEMQFQEKRHHMH